MKEEDLVKSLQEARLPAIELAAHRRALKMALLRAGYFQSERHANIVTVLKIKSVGKLDMLKGLASRQRVWKTAIVSALAVVVIAVAATVLPGIGGKSDKALAVSLAQSSQQIREIAGEGNLKTEVTSLADGKGTVVVTGDQAAVTAEVDIKTKTVTPISATPEFSYNASYGLGLAENNSPDTQRLSYQISIGYRGTGTVKLQDVGPVLGKAFSRLVISSQMTEVPATSLNTWDAINVSGEIIFNAKGLSKFDIVKLEPFITGFRINPETVVGVP